MFLERGCNKEMVKTMQVEYVILLLIFVAVLTAFVVNALNAKTGETADQVRWANVQEPLFYEQADPSAAAEIANIQLYENALAMLKKHGNKHISHNDVFFWQWGADGQNTAIDFDRWRFANVQRKTDILEAFRAMKAKNAQQAGKQAEAAKAFAGSAEK